MLKILQALISENEFYCESSDLHNVIEATKGNGYHLLSNIKVSIFLEVFILHLAECYEHYELLELVETIITVDF